MASVTASQPGLATLDPLKASCGGDTRSTAERSLGAIKCGGGAVTQLEALIFKKTEIGSFERKRRNTQIINAENKKIKDK